MINNKRAFMVDYTIYGDEIAYAIIELDQSVIDAVDDDWREHLYPLHTPEQIAAHICYNLVENRIQLSQMDGWADMSNDMVRMLEWPNFDFDMEARELK